MPYTLGANHSLAGTGSIAITSPIGLKYTVAAPAWLGSRFGTPPELVHAGRLALGNTDGYLPPLELTHAAGLFLPLPLGMTVLGFTMQPGVTAEVRELVDVPALGVREQPWDRNPAAIIKLNTTPMNGGAADTVPWTYTVPAGKRFRISSLRASVERQALASTPFIAQTYIVVAGQLAVQALLCGGTPGQTIYDADDGSGMVLVAGEVATANYQNLDTGGSCWMHAVMSGILFDA